jgi:hypothetical protein
VIAVVQGRRKAESSLKEFQDSQSTADYHAGWRYFFEKSDLPAGIDPAAATHRRQLDLERREAKESQEANSPVRPWFDVPNGPHRGFPRK